MGALPLMHSASLPYFEKMLQSTLEPVVAARAQAIDEAVPDSSLITCLELTSASLSSIGQGPNPHVFEARAGLLKDLTRHIFASER